MNSFMELAKARFSVRKFNSKPVEAEKVAKILEAAKIAPTAKNQQPQKIYVVRSQEGIEKLNQLSRCIYGATTVFMVAYDKTRIWQNSLEEGVTSGEVDAAIVGTHMMFEAAELGLGSCWVGLFPPKKTAAAFGLSDNICPVLLLPVGYYDESVTPAPRHTEYREDADMVCEL